MKKRKSFDDIFRGTTILHFPKHSLATFGSTALKYFMVSPVNDQSCRVREGHATAERPAILTPQSLQQRFEGFGEEAAEIGQWLLKQYGDSLRSLEYRFRNQLESTRLEHHSSKITTDRIKSVLEYENPSLVTLIEGPEEGWQLSLLKFVIDMSSHSFRSNVKELEERGFFDPPEEISARKQHREIKVLFQQARQDPAVTSLLAEKLRAYGLLEEYQDAFFELVTKPQSRR